MKLSSVRRRLCEEITDDKISVLSRSVENVLNVLKSGNEERLFETLKDLQELTCNIVTKLPELENSQLSGVAIDQNG